MAADLAAREDRERLLWEIAQGVAYIGHGQEGTCGLGSSLDLAIIPNSCCQTCGQGARGTANLLTAVGTVRFGPKIGHRPTGPQLRV